MAARTLLPLGGGLLLALSVALFDPQVCMAQAVRARGHIRLLSCREAPAEERGLDCAPAAPGRVAASRARWQEAARPSAALGGWHGREQREGRRWRRYEDAPEIDMYLLIKGGGLHVTDPGTDGLFTGFEIGGSAARVLDVGLSVDWFHRKTRDLRVLFETQGGYQLPIHGEITQFESSADLVPIGATLRVRVPLATQAVQPFVSGTLAYEILQLRLYERDSAPRPYADILGDSETFTGFGWQAAAGVQVAIAPAVSLFGEAGLHRSSPAQEANLDGAPVDLRVHLNGGFLRGGLRVGL